MRFFCLFRAYKCEFHSSVIFFLPVKSLFHAQLDYAIYRLCHKPKLEANNENCSANFFDLLLLFKYENIPNESEQSGTEPMDLLKFHDGKIKVSSPGATEA